MLPADIEILDLDTSSRDSFYSCPDLSSLQITHSSPQVPVSPGLAASLEGNINSEPPSPSLGPEHDTSSRGSKRKAVSKKARGVIGKVRALQRIAAFRMAHPSIKIDTNVHTTKRGLPEDNDAGLDILGSGDQVNPGLDVGDTEDIPQFLCQSVSGE